MIEATCPACGTLNRIAEADVPVGAKFVNCASCKSRVAVAAQDSGPVVAPTGTIDLGDLPAPRRQSALGPEASKPAPKSAIAAALDVELPAPRPRTPPRPLAGATPAAPAAPSIDLDDLMGGGAAKPELADLPAPRTAAPAAPPTPAGPPAIGLTDLPAPKSVKLPSLGPARPAAAPAVPPSTAAKPTAIGLSDLPAPKPKIPSIRPPAAALPPVAAKAPEPIGDLPAPKGPAGIVDLPTPKSPAGIVDLPTPKAPEGIRDLPAPKRPGGIADLPAPKGPAGILDLPTPKGPAGIVDLPTPKGPGGVVDLPTPKPGGATDLLTPKHPGGPDLPAPKGFFDDLPQPAAPAVQARSIDLPAPKGFFDDLPQPAAGSSRTQPTEAIAPKGFFDDLPQRAPAKGMDLTPATPGTEAIAPKGFFDDLPQPASSGRAFDDALDLEPVGGAELELDLGAPELELGEPEADAELSAPAPAKSNAFDDLDLSEPTASPIRFDAPGKRAPTGGGAERPLPKPLPPLAGPRGGASADAALELEEPRPQDPSATPKLGPKRPEAPAPVVDPVAAQEQRKKRTRLLAGIVLGVAVLGGGGFLFYQRHAAAQARQEQITQLVGTAHKAMTADDAGHWQRASRSAAQALELDSKNAEALGIAAESTLASAMADGQGGQPRIRKAGKIISDALGEGITGPELKRAQALLTISTAPDKAPGNIQALLAQAPKDGTLALYLGWAHAAKGDPAAAIKAFDQAIENAPAVKLYALYGRGRAKLALADLEGARTDFKAALDLSKDFVPAMVGLAAALPLEQSQQQEADLLAILARKDIDAADPRAVVLAWALAAEDAAQGGRLDAARERFRKALTLDDKNVGALTGLAEVELRDKKLEPAFDLITTALTQSADDARAQLVASEISIAQGKLDDAEARITALSGRTPPLAPLDGARLEVVRGKLLDKQGKPEEAVKAFIAGAKLAGDLDLRPTMAAVTKLGEMAQAEKDPKHAAELKDQADQLLGGLATKAQDDPQLAMTLGMAYLQVGDAAKAEPWLRRVVDTRANDVDATYQLGLAVAKLGRTDDAVELLRKAGALAPDRAEIGLALARTLDEAKRDAEAGELYTKLLTVKEPTLELRTHAGLFFARHGEMDKAAEQGKKILEVDRGNAAGHYLVGEGLLAQGKFDEARKQMTEASSTERIARYIDGQARATEQLAILRNNDLQLQELALHAYMDAAELDPGMFTSQLGQGRIHVQRGEAAKAIVPLQAAWKLAETAEVAYLIGVASQMLDQKPAAARWLEQSIALKPNPEAGFRLGVVYSDLNNGRAAQAAYASATAAALAQEKKTGETVPWLTEALGNYGDVSYKLHDEASARAAWEKFVQRNPKPGAKLDEIRRHLATDLR